MTRECHSKSCKEMANNKEPDPEEYWAATTPGDLCVWVRVHVCVWRRSGCFGCQAVSRARADTSVFLSYCCGPRKMNRPIHFNYSDSFSVL